ncbi:cysteine hydrolase [Amycolatopsis thermoflava]|uniref:cysteine hydrolase n=1 Tax=Amycolatopsis TaxID=1813 RepID=UPI0033AE4F46
MVSVDPARTAVLILDLQNEVIHENGAFGGSGAAAHAKQRNVVGNAARLAKAARAARAPVIHVHHQRSVGADNGADSKQNAPLWRDMAEADAMGTGWGAAPHEGIEPLPGDTVVHKQRVSAFYGTSLDIKLRGLGVEKVLVSGALTNLSVESTIRYGADLGYEMVLVEDACSSFDDTWHRAAVDFAVTHLGEVATVDEIVAAFDVAR